jgi:hypothetical protein
MRAFIVSFVFVGLILFFSGCKTKPDCEFNHTGILELTNADNNVTEVILDGNRFSELQPQQVKEFTVASGEHTIRCFSGSVEPLEVEDVISIVDCETTSYEIRF